MKKTAETSRCKVLMLAGLFLVSEPLHAEEAVQPDYSGSMRAEYEYRNRGEYSDHDAYGYWYFRGRNLADKHVEIYTSGRLHSDLDGTSASAQDPFRSIDDASQAEVRLLQFYIDIHDRRNEKALRYGRQYVDVADYIQIDGAQAMLFERSELGGRVFFGKPVSDYVSVAGDLFFGASLVGRPWKGNRSRVTFARYEDDSESAADNHYFLDIHQQVAEAVRTRGYLSIMNEEVRMGGADVFIVPATTDRLFDAVLGVRRWGDYTAETRVYSPLVDVLGDLEPFTTAYGRFTVQVAPMLYISPGAMMRDPDDANTTNRRFERYDLSFILEPSEALNASVSLEQWNVTDSEDFFGVSGDLRYRYRRLWEVSLGAAYVDYTYLQLSDLSVFTDDTPIIPIIQPLDGTRVERSPNTFTYFLRGKWNITDHLSLRLTGEIEDDSEEDDLAYRVRTSFEARL